MNKNKFLVFSIIILGLFMVVGCNKKTECEKNGHDWQPATCEKSGYCAKCDEIGEDPLGHDWKNATCTAPKTCVTCGATEGSTLAHNWNAATCDNPKTCVNCGATEGSALGHNWNAATCDNPKTCSICGKTEGSSLGHNWLPATEDAPKTCSTCGDTEGEPLTLLPSTTSQKLELPTEFNGKTVTWESLTLDVMLDDGTVVFNEVERIAILKATFTDEATGEVTEREVRVTVYPADIFVGQYDYAYQYYVKKLNYPLAAKVTLLTNSYNGCTVKYISQDPSILTDNGAIDKKTYEQQVIMNIYVIKDGIAVLYQTEVTIDDFNNYERLDFALEKLNGLVEQFEEGELETLPVRDDEYDVDYNWIADNPEFLVLKDRILTPINKTDVILKVTLSRAQEEPDKDGNIVYDTKDTKYFVSDVGGTISVSDYLDAWLPTILPTEIIAHRNEVTDPDPDHGDQQFFKAQYQVNEGGILNLIDGRKIYIDQTYYIDENRTDLSYKNFGNTYGGVRYTYHPDIYKIGSQSDLQAVYDWFYEGYTIPNEENLLWVVVHESGMPYLGNDAKLLATIQWRNAFEKTSSAGASWNFQVDHNVIYQSFHENVGTWHAGGDYGKWLPFRNSNSIGIEMAINLDGNYDGSLVHDTKLVAYLIEKYNLTMSNVVRHHDTSGKDCPAYMQATNRWVEFQQRVGDEYRAIKLLQDANVTWTISNPELFNEGPNGIWYAKAVTTPTNVDITLHVVKGSYTFTKTVTVTLYPDV